MNVNQYGEFAHCYDRMMSSVDYKTWVNYLESFLREYGAHTVLDAACGTGKIAVALAKDGYTMTGSDISEDMLMEARKYSLENGLRFLPFICQNMTDLSVHRPLDAVISTCDGVNYLTTHKDVSHFFSSAYRCLKPGGLLLFDISSEYKLQNILGNETFTEITDDYVYIWNNAYDPVSRLIDMELTFFVKKGDTYTRFSEEHIQRAHSVDELRELLINAGFSIEGIYQAFTRDEAGAECDRIQFVAQRNREKNG